MTLTDKEIIARYEAGESQRAIARVDGRSQSGGIRYTLLRNGIRLRDARQEWARGGDISGRIAVESGQLASIRAKGRMKAAEILRQKPNRKEATVAALLMTFYPDVWADIIWQRHLPQNLRGAPDLRHPIKVIGEYDGGGHNAFEDHRAKDATKDAERQAAGYAVIRETNPYVLVAKFAYAVRERK